MSWNVLLGAIGVGLVAVALALVLRRPTGRGEVERAEHTIPSNIAEQEVVLGKGFNPEQQAALDRLHDSYSRSQSCPDACCDADPVVELRALRTELAALRRELREAAGVGREGFLGTLNTVPPLRRAGSIRPD